MTMPRDPLADTLRDALASESSSGNDEDAILARALDKAMAQIALPAATSAAPTAQGGELAPNLQAKLASVRPIGSSRRGRMIKYALPIAAAFAASVAMGAIYTVMRSPKAASIEPMTAPPPARIPPIATGPSTAAAPAKDPAPTMSIDDLPNAPPPAVGSGASTARAPAAPASSATPAELFRDANAARRSGDVDAAIDGYKSLVAHHSGTAEAHAARVSLGRLLLDRRGDAAGALAQFDAYLSSNASDRALAEEARVGRALVFLRQGRTQEEQRAWQELLDKHPDSLHAARARERLRVLTGAPEAPAQ